MLLPKLVEFLLGSSSSFLELLARVRLDVFELGLSTRELLFGRGELLISFSDLLPKRVALGTALGQLALQIGHARVKLFDFALQFGRGAGGRALQRGEAILERGRRSTRQKKRR